MARQVRLAITLGALILALIHLFFPKLAIDGVTLALLAIAITPWLAPLFKSVEFPGGWKVEFRDLERTRAQADAVGLLAPQEPGEAEYSFERVATEDPNLALAGLRIEVERRLARLVEAHGISSRRRGVGMLLRDLVAADIIGQAERSVLADMLVLLSSAVHGAEVDP